MNEENLTIGYDLGRLAYSDKLPCDPLENKIFVAYMEKYDPPIVPFVKDFVSGWHDMADADEDVTVTHHGKFDVYTNNKSD